jgi:adenylate cyclase class 2
LVQGSNLHLERRTSNPEPPVAVEHEVKLVFESVEAARQAVQTAGGRLVVSRRLLRDVLFDTADGRMRRARTAVRIRRDSGAGMLTFKGPVQPGPVKSREEVETTVADPDATEHILLSLGLQPVFTSEKYREEFMVGAARVVIDETPIGVFVEIEAAPGDIDAAARALGRGPADYRLESYPRLYVAWCDARGITPTNMTF